MSVFKPAKEPLWEKTKREKKRGRIIRLLLLLTVLFIAINLAVKLPGIYRNLNRPFERFAGENAQTGPLDFSFRTNFLTISFEKTRLVDVALASYEPTDKKLTVLLFELPKNKDLRLPANKVFRNGGVESLEKYISINLGAIIDRYIALEDPEVHFTPENFAGFQDHLKDVTTFFKVLSAKSYLNKTLKTNLTSREMVTIFWKLRGAGIDQNDALSLKNLGTTNLQQEILVEVASNFFLDREVIKEAPSVTIRNSSGVWSLGANLAKYLTNLGTTLVSIETSDEEIPESTLVIRNKKKQIETRIVDLIELKKRKIKEDDRFSGDLLIILGKDASEKLSVE